MHFPFRLLFIFVCRANFKAYIKQKKNFVAITRNMVIMRAPSFLAEEVAGIVLCSSAEFAHFVVDAHLFTGTQHSHLRPVKHHLNHQRL